MRVAQLTVLLMLSASTLLAQALSLEGGVDAFRQNFTPTGTGRSAEAELGPSAAISAYLQVPALRSYYGLLLMVHTGGSRLAGDESDPSGEDGTQATLAAMAGWRAFPLDLEGDCDCPTWREENWLRKALFVELGLGYGRQTAAVAIPGLSSEARSGAAYLARVGLAHRLSGAFDVFGAIGAHGIIGGDVGYGVHHGAARGSLGVIYRP